MGVTVSSFTALQGGVSENGSRNEQSGICQAVWADLDDAPSVRRSGRDAGKERYPRSTLCCSLVRTHPLVAVRTPFWVMRGKASFKEKVTSVVSIDVTPIYPTTGRAACPSSRATWGGTKALYLATGADDKIARRIAEHLGIFDGVLASDGHTNLTGHHKLASLRERFQDGFDYIGNARPDMPLLAGAIEAMVANPDLALTSRLKAASLVVARRFEDRLGPSRGRS